MKLFTILLLITLTTPALATNLVCRMATPHDFFYGKINTFTITNIEGDENTLEASLDDQSTMSVIREAKVTSIHLSNERDNNYELSFPTMGLNNLLAGKAQGVRGTLYFSSAAKADFKTNLICRVLASQSHAH